MKRNAVKSTVVFVSLLVLAVTLAWETGYSQVKYPTKPVDLVVPNAPGGGTDTAARLLAEFAQRKWEVRVNVVNKAGGSGVPGTLDVMNSKPDGYTMLADAHSTSCMLAAFQPKLPFDVMNRTYCGRFVLHPTFYVVRTDAPWKSLKEMIDYAKSNPKAFKWASGAFGGMDNIAITRLFQVAGINPNAGRVVFDEGHAKALAALLGGHVSLATGNVSDVKRLSGPGGKINALAVSTANRAPGFESIPSADELGYKGVNILGWYGISGPPGLPEGIVKAWSDIMVEAVKDPTFVEKAKKLGVILEYGDSTELRARVQKEYEIYLEIAKSTGVR